MEGMLRSADDVVAAIARDTRLEGCTLRRQEAGWLELDVSGLARGRGVGTVLLVLAWPEVWTRKPALAPHVVRAQSGNYGLLLIGDDDRDFERHGIEALAEEADVSAVGFPISLTRFVLALRTRADACALRLSSALMELELERAHYENELLIDLGRDLSNTPDVDDLLTKILAHARQVTGADAGSVYEVLNHDKDTEREIRFVVSQNDSRKIATPQFKMKVTAQSIVGECVLSGKTLNIPNLYAADSGYSHDRGAFDDPYRYETRSMLTVPMLSARAQVIGVVQLINKRAKGYFQLDQPADFVHGVVPFDEVSENYAKSLASQAGIALENTKLYGEIKTLFEGFVEASVTAIESRDPTTSGHSRRVADLTVGLAEAVHRVNTGPYGYLRFTPDELTTLTYAALLHDFGKVGVREHVLVKAKKLYEHQREAIVERFQFIRRGIELEGMSKKLRYAIESSREKMQEEFAAVDGDLGAKIAELDGFIHFILAANEPTVLEQGGFERVADIAARTYLGLDGQPRQYLSAEEASALQILRGSLTDAERDEINSHVSHTYNFLKEIPWGRQFRDVPDIAHAHHEKLDGSGYPLGLRADAIPPQARMMTISDIYDALTAKDRPYKKAIPREKALDILGFEVKKGMLDSDLFGIFVEAKVWQHA